MPSLVSKLIQDHRETVEALAGMSPEIERLGALLVECLQGGNKVMLCGNGGSAADAQHIAAELVARFETERRALPALALTTDTSALTAIGNDYGYLHVFSRQVAALGRQGDALIAISTSGNSANVLEAVQAAREQGVVSIALLGGSGGALKAAADHALVMPSAVTARVQECHILVGHVWCAMVDAAFR